jgi:hypothetical protein
LLQKIWQHQRLQRDALRTLDGQPLRVLHPGFLNREAGPDFQGAILQLGEAPAGHGDVEVDVEPGNWHLHRHDRNPAYRQVILHAVWRAEPSTPHRLPTCVLEGQLDAPLAELQSWLELETALPTDLSGRCAAPLRQVPDSVLHELLRQAALVRLQRKAGETAARARQVGWEQALWEGLFAALGYKHNVWPMRGLAELRPRILSPEPRPDLVILQARLLGLSGLLPAELTHARPQTDRYLRSVWDHWWRERSTFASHTLPRSIWRLHGLRPANHPLRRLALASHWLARGDLPARLEPWFAGDHAGADLPASLLSVLQTGPDEFWSRHWTLRSSRLPAPQPLLGLQRVTDLAVNAILPWFWVRASSGRNEALRQKAEQWYFAWPKGEDNAVLRQARQRLLGGAPRRLPAQAALQQGLLQIVHDFCEHSDALCDECQLPQLVLDLGSE